MKLTNEEIFTAKEPLQKLLNERLPVRISYQLAKMASKLNNQFEIIERVKDGLIKTYGEADRDNPTRVEVKPDSEQFPKFIEEMDELFAHEIEIVLDKVILPQEVDGKSIQIEPSVLMALEKFIEVE